MLIPFNKNVTMPKKWYGQHIHMSEGKLGKSEDIQLFHYSFYSILSQVGDSNPTIPIPQRSHRLLEGTSSRSGGNTEQFPTADGRIRKDFTGE